jgi:L-aminopeptidase/D-esterase-like protein
MKIINDTITTVPGIQVGHAKNEEALTGCTVIICENGAIGGVEQSGGAPGTRETDALGSMDQKPIEINPLIRSRHSTRVLDPITSITKEMLFQ